MKKSTLAQCLKIILAGCAACFLLIYLYFIPQYGQALAQSFPEYAYCYWPWLIFLWLTGLPCFGVLYLGWKIAASMQKDQEFTQQNSRRFCWAARLMTGDALFLVGGTLIYWLLGMAHPGMVILSWGLGFAGGAIAVIAKALEMLTDKAAVLQDQSDWTI